MFKKKAKSLKRQKGFTLIELLLVIAIIAILTSVTFMSTNPLRNLQETRDSARWLDLMALVNAVALDQVASGGNFIEAINALELHKVYMIGTAVTDCNSKNAFCLTPVADNTSCMNPQTLIDHYHLTQLPVSPSAYTTWSRKLTGYTIEKMNAQRIKLRACEAEAGYGEINLLH